MRPGSSLAMTEKVIAAIEGAARFQIWIGVILGAAAASPAEDCNSNGREDSEDLSRSALRLQALSASPIEALAIVPIHALDLDLDGDEDLIVRYGGTRLPTVHESLGNGELAPARPLPGVSGPLTMEAADLDGDHFPELITANFGSSSVSLFRGAAQIDLVQWQSVELPERKVIDAVPVDVDLDGDVDLGVLTNRLDEREAARVQWLLNDAAHSFQLGGGLDTQRGRAFDLLALDLDADGDGDIATLRPDGVPPTSAACLAAALNEQGRFTLGPEACLRGTAFLLGSFRTGQGLQLAAFTSAEAAVFAMSPVAELRKTHGAAFEYGGAFPTWGDWTRDGLDDVLRTQVSSVGCPGKAAVVALFEQDPGSLTPLAILDRVSIDLGAETPELLADLTGDGWPELVLISQTFAELRVFGARGRALSEDCDANGVPDECDVPLGDCNSNGVPDACDLTRGTSSDCDGDSTPDECELDCDRNGTADDCDVSSGRAADCDRNGVPDACELAWNDLDGDGSHDACPTAAGRTADCNLNGLSDGADLAVAPRFSALEVVVPPAPPFTWTQGDMNGDSRTDLVVAQIGDECSAFPGRLRVLLQAARGWIESEAVVLPMVPQALAALDLEGDLDLDVAVSAGSKGPLYQLLVFTNEGNGQLRLAQRLKLAEAPIQLFGRDFDGDGDHDILAFRSGGMLFRNGGMGQLETEPRTAAPAGTTAHFCVDLDQNSSPDLLVSLSPGRERWPLFNNGSGEFQFARTGRPLASSGNDASFAAGDVDGDGDVDAATVEAQSRLPHVLRIHRNGGDGTFEELLESSWSGSAPLLEPLGGLADADGDGDLDAFRRLRESNMYWFGFLPNEGGGRYGEAVNLSRSTQGGPFSIHSFDEGLLLVGEPGLARMRRSEAQSLAGPLLLATQSLVQDLDAADIDGDSHADLILASRFEVHVRWGSKSGSFDAETVIDVDSNPVLVRAADLDLDGDMDLATANSLGGPLPDNTTILQNDGLRKLSTARNLAIGRLPSALEPLDLDADGDADLAAANRDSSSVTVLWNSGDGRYPQSTNTAVPHPALGLAIGDFDGDRNLDLATLDPSPRLDGEQKPLPGQATVLWGPAEPFTESSIVSLPPSSQWITAADADGDAQAELAALSAPPGPGASGSITLQGFGGRQAGPPVSFAVLRGFFLSKGDLNADGHPDLATIAIGRSSGWIEAFENDGHGGFSRRTQLNVGQLLHRITLRDLDGDGLAEILGPSHQRPEVVVIRNLSAPRSLDADRNGVPDECVRLPDARFVRGDASADGAFNVTDPIAVLRYLFHGDSRLRCLDSADADDDGRLSLTDAVRLLLRLFGGAGPLPEPHPACGDDSTQDALSCSEFGPCR